MTSKIKVAAIQFRPILGHKVANLRSLAALVTEAAKNDAQLIVLPEMAALGYSFMKASEVEPLAEVLGDFNPEIGHHANSMDIMYALAHTYKVHIAWGLAEKDKGTGNLYNSQVLMCPDGKFISYKKANLFSADWLWCAEGRGNPTIMHVTFDTPSGEEVEKKVGLLICRDIRDKKDDAWSSFYEPGDADIICFSSAWGKGGMPATAWMDFVKENNTTLIVSNRYGIETPNDFGDGGVCVIEPSGKVHCEGLVWSHDCIVYAEI